MKKKVLVVGGASYDSIIYLDNFPEPKPKTFHQCEYRESIGSTGSGKALNLARLGFDVTFHALIGDDQYGGKVQQALNQPNIDFMQYNDPNGTQRHVNIMNKEGERISIFVNNSSDEPQIEYSIFQPLIYQSDFVVINITNYSRYVIPYCKELKKPIWTDLHDYNDGNTYHQDFIDGSDYIFLSSDNLPNYRQFMADQMAKGKEIVVCTHGKRGASALTKNGEWIEQPILKEFELVDSNGAGDAFFSGFLYGYSIGKDIGECMKLGTVAGGMCINSEMLYSPDLGPDKINKLIGGLSD